MSGFKASTVDLDLKFKALTVGTPLEPTNGPLYFLNSGVDISSKYYPARDTIDGYSYAGNGGGTATNYKSNGTDLGLLYRPIGYVEIATPIVTLSTVGSTITSFTSRMRFHSDGNIYINDVPAFSSAALWLPAGWNHIAGSNYDVKVVQQAGGDVSISGNTMNTFLSIPSASYQEWRIVTPAGTNNTSNFTYSIQRTLDNYVISTSATCNINCSNV